MGLSSAVCSDLSVTGSVSSCVENRPERDEARSSMSKLEVIAIT